VGKAAFTQTSGKILPRPGDGIADILHGEIVKGRVTVIATNPSPATGSSGIEVRAEKI